MSFKRILQNAVDTAFKKIGDFAETVVLHKVTDQDFEMETLDVGQDAKKLVVKAIKFVRKRGSVSRQDVFSELSLMFRTIDVPFINACDTLSFRGDTYRIIHPVIDNGFVTELDCTKEGL